jgi:outer membrane immunogenic protein
VRKFAIILGITLGLCGSTSAFGQDVPRAEVFGGYSYLNFDTVGVTDRLNMNGWEASAAFNFNRWVGVEGDFSGHYKGNCGGVTGLTCKDLSFMGGPRFTYRRDRITAFAHGLFGGDNGSLGLFHVSLSDTPFAWAAGGGVDYAVTKTISIRMGQVDYFMTRHLNDLGLANQNNIRVSAGIVFTFGGTREASSGARNQTGSAPTQTGRNQAAGAPTQTGPTSEAALLGVSGYATDAGFKITSVQAGTPAAQIYLNPGDIISNIDGREVHSSRDIESAIAASTSGTIKVSCLIQTTAVGMVHVEREVKVR